MNAPIPFGKYLLLERINAGGMAEVFMAKTFGVEGFERFVAVKRILAEIAADKAFIDMFIDEAKIAVQLNHANIGQIFDLGRVEGSYFIAMEYIRGKDLRAIFDCGRSSPDAISVAQACFIVMKVCEGLDYAHNKRDPSGAPMNLIHRDVSPQNVLISYEGEVKLIDFGIAKAAGNATKTQAGMLKGKFGYMSPEQVRGLPLDRRSDIFAIGVILYELLTSRRLFHGESDFSTLEKVRRTEVEPPSTYNHKIGEDLEQIVMQALARDGAERYQNAIDLHDDLQAYLYASGTFYSRKDLSAWMKETFARDMEEARRKQQAYDALPLPRLSSAGEGTAPGGASAEGAPAAMPVQILATPPEAGISESLLAPSTAILEPEATGASGSAVLPGDDVEDAPLTPIVWEDDEPETHVYAPELCASDDSAEPGSFAATTGATPTEVSAVVPLSEAYGLEDAEQPADDTAEPEPAAQQLPSSAVPRARRPGAQMGVSRWRRLLPFLVAFGGAVSVLAAILAYYFLVELKRPGAIEVVSTPANVALFLDGQSEPAGQTPITVRDLPAGTHQVVVRKRGFRSWRGVIEVRPGETTRVTFELTKLAVAAVDVRTVPPGAEVYLDGKRLEGQTPLRITRLSAGGHRLEVRKSPQFEAARRKLDLKAGEQANVTIKLNPSKVRLVVRSEPRGKAYLVRDGEAQLLGNTPVETAIARGGDLRAIVRRQGYEEWAAPVVFDEAGAEGVVLSARLTAAKAARVAESPPSPQPEENKPPAKSKRPATSKPPSRASLPKAGTRTAKVAAKGTLLINSVPWAQIFIDGEDTGLTTPQRAIELDAGRHEVTLSNPKFEIDTTFTVVIRPRRVTRVLKTLK